MIAICYRDCRKGGAGRRAFLKKKLKHEFKEPEEGLWHDLKSQEMSTSSPGHFSLALPHLQSQGKKKRSGDEVEEMFKKRILKNFISAVL